MKDMVSTRCTAIQPADQIDKTQAGRSECLCDKISATAADWANLLCSVCVYFQKKAQISTLQNSADPENDATLIEPTFEHNALAQGPQFFAVSSSQTRHQNT